MARSRLNIVALPVIFYAAKRLCYTLRIKEWPPPDIPSK